jgi:uncharacterized cupin superfamily protein
MTHTLLHRDDPSIENFRGVFFKIRKALGTTAFGLNEVVLPPGMAGNEHDEVETGHEEVYIVLDGTGRFVIDGAEVDVAAGDYLHVAPAATRQVTAGPEGLRFVAIGGPPRPAYDGRPSL